MHLSQICTDSSFSNLDGYTKVIAWMALNATLSLIRIPFFITIVLLSGLGEIFPLRHRHRLIKKNMFNSLWVRSVDDMGDLYSKTHIEIKPLYSF